MKKLIISFLFILAVLLLGNCKRTNSDRFRKSEVDKKTVKYETNNKENSLLEFDIENLGKPANVTLSELGFIDIDYIPLETNNNSLVSRIYKLRAENNCFLVKQSSGILKFKADGTFIASIGNKGRGPQEYLNVQDFDIEPKTNNVYILSAWEDKIYIYSHNGEFVKTIPAPLNTTDFTCLDEYILCYSKNLEGSIDNSFDVINYEGNIVKSFPNKYKYKRGKIMAGLHTECCVYKHNGKLYTKEIHCDTVYAFEDLEFIPSIILNRGKKRLPPEARIINHEGESKFEPYSYEFDLFAFGGYIYAYVVYERQIYSLIASKNDGLQYLKVTEKNFINDIDGGLNVHFEIKKSDNTVISWITPLKLKAHVASESFKISTPKYPEKKKELEILANSLDENDNTVLMLVKLKE